MSGFPNQILYRPLQTRHLDGGANDLGVLHMFYQVLDGGLDPLVESYLLHQMNVKQQAK